MEELSKEELEEIIKKVKDNPAELAKISDVLKIKYPEICIEAINSSSTRGDGDSPLAYVPKEVQMNHPEICKKAVGQERSYQVFDGWAYYVDQRMWLDYPEENYMVRKVYPNSIRYVHEDVLRAHPDILLSIEHSQVEEAIEQVPKDILQANPKICKRILEDGHYIQSLQEIAENMTKEERWEYYKEEADSDMEWYRNTPWASEKYRNLGRVLKNRYSIALKLKENPTVATHFGDDLDNRSSIHVLEEFAKEVGIIDKDESLNVERVPAGQTKENIVNVDTGGHKGSNYEGETIVIDGDPDNGVKSAIDELHKNAYMGGIPKQILECADTMPTKTSIFDTRSGMSLQKFATIEQVFKMAEDGALTRELTDEELEKYGLVEAQKEQQKTIDEAKEKIDKYTKTLANGEKIVIAPEFVKAGSMIAYESGIKYYASVDNHKSGKGVTMSINAKPGEKLPENIVEYGNKKVELLSHGDGTSGAFVHPNGSMFVAGGPKNPDDYIQATQEDTIEEVTELFNKYAQRTMEEKSSIGELKANMEKNSELTEKNRVADVREQEANELKRDVESEKNKHEQNKEDKNI